MAGDFCVEDMIGSFVLQILSEDSRCAFYLGSAGATLVVLCRALGGHVAVLSLLVAIDA